MKTLITYFSAEFGNTAALAKRLAELTGGDLFEIMPVEPYTAANVKYTNPLARCNKEKFGKKDVPVVGYPENFDNYDAVLIGFPIWYWGAPNVVSTFCKELDFAGKKVAVFATSGGSNIGKTASKLQPSVKGAEIMDADVFNGATDDELKSWLEKINI